MEGLKDNFEELLNKLYAVVSSLCPNANSASTVPQAKQTSSAPVGVEIFL
jgi:hypothetical protein